MELLRQDYLNEKCRADTAAGELMLTSTRDVLSAVCDRLVRQAEEYKAEIARLGQIVEAHNAAIIGECEYCNKAQISGMNQACTYSIDGTGKGMCAENFEFDAERFMKVGENND